jgi:hypothetical protein
MVAISSLVFFLFFLLTNNTVFLYNYVPRLFLLTCVKFHRKKIDNNDTLTHICLLPLVRIGVICALRNFQQYFSYIVAVSFIEGGNRNARRKPPTWQTWSHNVVSRTPRLSGIRNHKENTEMLILFTMLIYAFLIITWLFISTPALSLFKVLRLQAVWKTNLYIPVWQ